jgi:uncharacterized damage-inducible protein DinB
MPRLAERTLLTPSRGHRRRETGLYAAQLADLSRRLRQDTRGLTVRELEWQPAPGMNSIGMLLAHIAIVEVWWIEGAVRQVPPADVDFTGKLGIGGDDDGMPAGPRDRHPRALQGKTLADYDRLLLRGRRNLLAAIRGLTARDLAKQRRRIRRDGKLHEYNVEWVLYHLVEHFAGHYGQILMLRHAYRARRR